MLTWLSKKAVTIGTELDKFEVEARPEFQKFTIAPYHLWKIQCTNIHLFWTANVIILSQFALN
jgi:hypothetical protein